MTRQNHEAENGGRRGWYLIKTTPSSVGALVTHTWVQERATVAGRGHFPGSLSEAPGYLGTRHMGPTAGPGASTCCVPHILPRHRGASGQDSHFLAIALDGCTDAQCGFVVVLVLLFLQKLKEVCRPNSALPSMRPANLLSGGQAELS